MAEARAPWRRAPALVAAVLAVLVVALGYGVSTARVTSSFGPHTARYLVTLDSTVTVDLGPLGTIEFDSPVAGPLGARVVVQEIPDDLTALGSADTLAQLTEDLEAYVQFFSGPATTVEHVARALVADAVRRALAAAVVLVLAGLGLRALLGPDRRHDLALAAHAHRGRIAGGAVVLVVIAALPAAVPRPEPTVPGGAVVFEGTALEGARITGRLAGVVDTYGGMLIDEVRANDAFYAGATGAVRRAWERAVPVPDEPTPRAEGAATVLIVSDLHCNVGMAQVIAEVAELAGADVVLDAGDTTVNGTAVESYCVQALTDALPAATTEVVAGGNHDSEETAAQHRAAGAVVLTGDVVEVAGLTILGDRDFQVTRIGVGTTQAGEETLSQVGHRLAETACAADGVDLLLIHQPEVGQETLERGCARTQVSGHYHRRIGPEVVGDGVRYVSASTAGAVLGGATIGPLQGVAEMTVLRLQDGVVQDWRVIDVRPDGAAVVSEAKPWPRPVPPELMRPDPPPGTPL